MGWDFFQFKDIAKEGGSESRARRPPLHSSLRARLENTGLTSYYYCVKWRVLLVCCLIDFQLNNAECFFIDKATERGDAVASLSEVNAVRWENRQVI